MQDTLITAAELALTLGVVERATLHQDGKTKESVSTHSLMLAMIAVELLELDAFSNLDKYKTLKYCLVHDALESITGDVDTFEEYSREQKDEDERRALREFTRSNGRRIPNLTKSITNYAGNAEKDLERDFVCVLDKILPKLTHILNEGQRYRELGLTRNEVEERNAARLAELVESKHVHVMLFELFDIVALTAENTLGE